MTNSFTLDPVRRSAIQRIWQRIRCKRTFSQPPVEQRSILTCLVCLSVCICIRVSVWISLKPHAQASQILFACTLSMAVARSSAFGGVVICYVLPDVDDISCYHIEVRNRRRENGV